MELKGSRTELNLQTAFAGESQARNKYTYFASVAKKEGYEQIAAIFQETADNEKEHAKMWFKHLYIFQNYSERHLLDKFADWFEGYMLIVSHCRFPYTANTDISNISIRCLFL